MRRAGVATLLTLLLLVAATMLVALREWRPAWRGYQVAAAEASDGPTSGRGVVAVDVAATGERELCLTCHAGLEEMSRSHPRAFGCVVCHGGQAGALDAEVAHQGLVDGANPSALDVVERGCGAAGPGGERCHGGGALDRDHVARVRRSLQATYAGGIGAVLTTFSGIHGPTGVVAEARDARATDGLPRIVALDARADEAPPVGQTARDLRQSCVTGGCHLNSSGGEVDGSSGHAAGCAACHVLSTGAQTYQGADAAVAASAVPGGGRHEFTVGIPFTQCNTCHNRGIYDLRGLRFYPRDDMTGPQMYEGSEASYYRPGERYAQCEVTLNCIDCHTQAEIMGDGRLLADKAAAQRTRCGTCHGTPENAPASRTVSASDTTLRALGRASTVYDVRVGDRLATAGGQQVLSSTRWEDDRLIVTDKVDGSQHPVPLVRGSGCEQDGSSQRAQYCHTCHYQEQP